MRNEKCNHEMKLFFIVIYVPWWKLSCTDFTSDFYDSLLYCYTSHDSPPVFSNILSTQRIFCFRIKRRHIKRMPLWNIVAYVIYDNTLIFACHINACIMNSQNNKKFIRKRRCEFFIYWNILKENIMQQWS
jgi:hypothetical protein